MSKFRNYYAVACLATCGVCATAPIGLAVEVGQPPVGQSATPDSHRPASMRDIALAPGGLLIGQILDGSMRPVGGEKIAIQADGQTAASTVTDADGVFAVAGLRGGVHQVVTKDSMQNCRLWAAGTAPPRAEANLRFVPGQGDVVRGQWGSRYDSVPHRAAALATNPWVVGGVVATAIAVPVVLHNIDDDDSD